MANKKASAISTDCRSMQTGEFRPLRDDKRSVRDAVLETLKSGFHIGIDITPPIDVKNELRKAISEAVSNDAETHRFTSVKDTKQRRRDIIFNTIMKHSRNLDS